MSVALTSPIGSEALDGPACPEPVARATLRDIAVSNRLFGGRAAVAFGIDLLVTGRTSPRPLTLLDLGAGSGDIAAFLARRQARRGLQFRPVALDRHRAAAGMCREAGLPSVVADLWALPLPERSVDIVVASQVLHHFRRDAGARLLEALERAARVGVVIADLCRARAAQLGIWLASFALAFHRVTRHDSVISVRRGFTKSELEALLLAAGIRAPVHRRPGYRLVAAWRVPGADG